MGSKASAACCALNGEVQAPATYNAAAKMADIIGHVRWGAVQGMNINSTAILLKSIGDAEY
jgi:hypothetical protein